MMYALMKDNRVICTQFFSTKPSEEGWELLQEQPIYTLSREDKKELRQANVDSIVVQVGSKQFEGDEVSQNRMSRAIVALQAAGVDSTYWTLYDNSVSVVTLAELAEALIKSGMEQTRLWSIDE
jgi:hypothetical protein